MSTQSVTPAVSLTNILNIIQLALSGLSKIPVVGGDAALAGVFIGILQYGLNAYHSAAGQPLDVTKLPLETPVV